MGRLMDILTGRAPNSLKRKCCEPAEVEPAPKRPSSSTIERHYYELVNEDQFVRREERGFIDKSLCVREAESKVRSGETIRYKSVVIPCPTGLEVIKRTYGFLLKNEYVDRMKRMCRGCEIDSPQQLDHIPGCISIGDEVDMVTAHAAHIRISAQRLTDASRMMLGVYDEADEWATIHRCIDVLDEADYKNGAELRENYEADFEVLNKY